MTSSAASVDSSFGAKPPSSPTAVARPFSFKTFLSEWNTSQPMRSPSENDFAPVGMIMNSWKSIGASECAPPFMMFIIGTGSTLALGPPRYL